ncbi:MAG: V-type ATP synthase subunit A, partial [Anaerolineales bacterium]
MKRAGDVIWINGPVLRARMTTGLQMLEQVEVGEQHLVGEVISLQGDVATVQVYEETVGLRPGAPIYGLGMPLGVELGPGLMSGIFDGIQRPLEVIEARTGIFIAGGIAAPALDRERRWAFEPAVSVGQVVHGGETLGTVVETPLVTLRLPLPARLQGEVTWVAAPGEYTVLDTVARVRTPRGEEPVTMMERWPVRQPRPNA